MTNQEAINVMRKYTDETISPVAAEAHKMAIAALEEKAMKEESQKREDKLFQMLKRGVGIEQGRTQEISKG